MRIRSSNGSPFPLAVLVWVACAVLATTACGDGGADGEGEGPGAAAADAAADAGEGAANGGAPADTREEAAGAGPEGEGGEAMAAATDTPRVALETSEGTIVVALYPQRTPQTVENFLAYVREGYYDGLIFHRVIPGFMIQAGGYTPGLEPREPTRDPVPNEADAGLMNRRATIAMARTGDPHSATSQFFINVADNPSLDFRSQTPQGWGYTAFGHVVEGMEVADAIAEVPTEARGAMQNVPVEPVVIEDARVVEDGAASD